MNTTYRCASINRLMAAFLLFTAVSCCSVAEVLIEEQFSGRAEHDHWLYNMISGAGSVSFEAATPGVARYLIDGPGTDSSYHNAELYQHFDRTPPYCTFEVRLRNSNNCGFDAPGLPSNPDPLYGTGSRGWGFWNFSTNPHSTPINTIWFYCLSPESDEAFRGRGIWIVRDNNVILRQELEIDLTQWHTYRIQWRADYIGVFIDDMETPVAEITDPGLIPDVAMTYTTWIDNYIVTGTSLDDMQYTWLPVPDFEQYIEVDYIRVYTEPTISADMNCQPTAGVVPFNTAMTVTLDNLTGYSRRTAARIEVTRGDGAQMGNWRRGTTNIDPGGSFTSSWSQHIPALGSLIGDNVFKLVAEDVTPPPYNQPPYPAAGEGDTGSCTITGAVN